MVETLDAPIATEAEQRFKTNATRRTRAALKQIQLLRHLKSKHYDSTPEQRDAVIAALRSEVDALEDEFQGRKPQRELFAL
jgi:hypothetical protein